jgi:hypothetical protein
MENLMTDSLAFFDALLASQRAPEIPESSDIFGWLIGSWEIDALVHTPNGQIQKERGEIHASWVLAGRAVQDLFIFPRRADRTPGNPVPDERYATTIRIYDQALDTWHVHFLNPPVPQFSARLTARRNRNDILLEGHLADDTPIRWRYLGPTSKSFYFTAEKLGADYRTWELYLELFGRHSDTSP